MLEIQLRSTDDRRPLRADDGPMTTTTTTATRVAARAVHATKVAKAAESGANFLLEKVSLRLCVSVPLW